MKKALSIYYLFFLISISFAQEKTELKTTFSGFIETYYSYDFDKPTSNSKLPFMYNYNRQNEFNLNIGLLRAKLEYDNTYASIALHSGTYVEDNYASEKIKYVNEAYVGINLDKANKHALEVGILPSYIGFETATSASNLTLTRSLLAENSPYFMTGLKYNYKPSDKWNFSALLTNGWQRINKPQKDVAPSLGTQVIYKQDASSTFNWSTFIGKEFNGADFKMRYFSNLYFDQKWNEKWRTIAGFDYGVQTIENSKTASWLSPVFIAQYSINSKWKTAFRAEYYQDKKKVIIATSDAFKTTGTSLNFDYLPNSKVKLRTEARYLDSKNDIFEKGLGFTNSNFFITTSLSFEF
jgi:Putative beta-barrel porin-2, OmpL-like. bbp2